MNRLLAIVNLLVAGLALLCGCSIGPLAGGGGTETGNPGAVAAVSQAFSMLDSIKRYDVAHYLPQGSAALDPAGRDTTFLQLAESAYLVKQRALTPDTVYYDSLAGRDTLMYVDTIVAMVSRCDTVVKQEAADSTVLVTCKVVRETTFVARPLYLNTIVRHYFIQPSDTTDAVSNMTPKQDSSYIVMTVPPMSTSTARADNLAGLQYQQPEYSDSVLLLPANILFDLKGSVVSPAPTLPATGAYTVTGKNQLTTSIVWQNSDLAGDFFIESLVDADGDYYLESAGAPSSPQIRRVAGERQDAAVTRDVMLFDAGEDKFFNTTADNRVLSFIRLAQTPLCSSSVRFALKADTSLLDIEEYFSSGNAQIRRTRASISDGFTRSSQRIAGLGGLAVFHSEIFDSINLRLTPLAKPLLGDAAPNCSLYAKIWFRDGRTGTLDQAVIDPQAGTVSGKFFYKGETVDMTINRNGAIVTTTP